MAVVPTDKALQKIPAEKDWSLIPQEWHWNHKVK